MGDVFFAASKIFWALAAPSTALVLIIALGALALLFGRARAARWLIVPGALLLFIAAHTPLGEGLLAPLETRFERPTELRGGDFEGIIVLGGAVDPDTTEMRTAFDVNEAGERLFAAAMLAKRFPDKPILLSGGSGRLRGPLADEARAKRDLLTSLGVPRDQILLEDRSRNTSENATNAAEVLGPRARKPWLLITSAFHMPRAVGCFREAGVTVIAWPVDWRADPRWVIPLLETRGAAGLARVDLAIREYIGLLAYRMTGRIKTLFPSPRAPSRPAPAPSPNARNSP